jgi:uncharacterized membrane protein HdeD (DUF308 family)
MFLSPDGQEGWWDALILAIIGVLATVVRMANDPPRSAATTIWFVVAGLGLATGGWLIAKAVGLEGWSAMATAWVFGALGSDALLPVVKKWIEGKIGKL